MPRHKFSLVACARWEEDCIQEWIEYHQSIGFDHVYLYSNDDDPTALARAVAPYLHGDRPLVTLRHWTEVGQQAQIYLHFMETFSSETEWFAFLDIDEFFVLKGVDDIYAFMLDYRTSVDCLYFNWVIYGHNDKLQRNDAPVLTSYLRRARVPAHATKMLCRSSAIPAELVRDGHANGRGAFWHFLDNYYLPGVRFRDVLYEPMDGYSAQLPDLPRRFVDRPGFTEAVLDRAYIAHFQFKSEEDFLRRWQRGGFDNGDWKALHENGGYRQVLAETNEVYDGYLAEYWFNYTQAERHISTRQPDMSSRYQNVALNKPSWQSSIFEPSDAEPAGSRVWGGGNNGLRSGVYGFHTKSEGRPWWIVDLLGPHEISEIRVYNRCDFAGVADRAKDLDILGSGDGAAWTVLLSNQAGPFGADGQPLVVRPGADSPCRFIMVRLRTEGMLHLLEVEVYGAPSSRHIPFIGTALPRATIS